MQARQRQRGFTLIELVVVITILGILAAFAVPRFAALEGQARQAARDSLGGSIRSAAALSHALWLAQGQPGTVTMEGQVITMTNGYPNTATIDNALADFSGYTYVPGTFTRAAGPACTVTYGAAPANGVPTITTTGGAC